MPQELECADEVTFLPYLQQGFSRDTLMSRNCSSLCLVAIPPTNNVEDKGRSMDEDVEFAADTRERKAPETTKLGRILKIAGRITSQPGQWSRAQLANEFEVAERTIDRDLEMLRGLGYEITQSKTAGYSFAHTPALPPVLLSLPDVLALTLAAELARDRGDIDPASLGAALARLIDLVPAQGRPMLQSELALREKDARIDKQRQALLETVQQARLEGRQARMVYATGERKGELSERTIEVFAVYPYERSWMITAFDYKREEIRDFKIDRVQSMTLLATKYAVPAGFDIAAYRSQGWGALRGTGGDPVPVKLLFDQQGGRWVQEEHRPEQINFAIQQDGTVKATLTTPLTPEFIRWIVWYGPHCRVLTPDALRAQVHDTLHHTLTQYQPDEAHP